MTASTCAACGQAAAPQLAGASPVAHGTPFNPWTAFSFVMTKRYATFSGRAERREFWMFALFIFGAYIALLVLAGLASAISGPVHAGDPASGATVLIGVLFLIAALAIFIPSLALRIRRLHDIGKSGWFFLLVLIPLVGAVVLLVFDCLPGDKTSNAYGPPPSGLALS